MPLQPSRFMGDGPVALLVAHRPACRQADMPRSCASVVLATNNGVPDRDDYDAHRTPWYRRLIERLGLCRGA